MADQSTNASKLNNQVAGDMSVNYANSAGNADTVDGKHFTWHDPGANPNYVWGGNDGVNMYVYSPSRFNVNYANNAGKIAGGEYVQVGTNQEVRFIYPGNGAIHICASNYLGGQIFYFSAGGGHNFQNNKGQAIHTYASDFIKASSIIQKENVTLLDTSLDKVLNLNITEYDRIEGNHEIGLIVEDNNTPNELVNIENNYVGISIGNTLFMTTKALQEHYDITDNQEFNSNNAISELYETQLNDNTQLELIVANLYEQNNQLEMALVDLYESQLNI